MIQRAAVGTEDHCTSNQRCGSQCHVTDISGCRPDQEPRDSWIADTARHVSTLACLHLHNRDSEMRVAGGSILALVPALEALLHVQTHSTAGVST